MPLFATWPDNVDLAVTIAFLAFAVSLPVLGYAFMVVDFLRATGR